MPTALLINVTDPQHRKDMTEALERALNCWEGRPEWLVQLYDKLKGDANGNTEQPR